MVITIRYFDREHEYEIDSKYEHYKCFSGNTAKECMMQYEEFIGTHDLAKFTCTEIVGIVD